MAHELGTIVPNVGVALHCASCRIVCRVFTAQQGSVPPVNRIEQRASGTDSEWHCIGCGEKCKLVTFAMAWWIEMVYQYNLPLAILKDLYKSGWRDKYRTFDQFITAARNELEDE